MTYQAWVVQKINGVPYNVILGREHATKEDAYETILTYQQYFGKCDAAYVEPTGTEIPTEEPEPKKPFWKRLLDWL